MRCCAFKHCKNNTYRLSRWQGQKCDKHGVLKEVCACPAPFELYPFPTEKKNAKRRMEWIRLVNRQDPHTKKMWIPNFNDRVCSKHFLNNRISPECPNPVLNLTGESKKECPIVSMAKNKKTEMENKRVGLQNHEKKNLNETVTSENRKTEMQNNKPVGFKDKKVKAITIMPKNKMTEMKKEPVWLQNQKAIKKLNETVMPNNTKTEIESKVRLQNQEVNNLTDTVMPNNKKTGMENKPARLQVQEEKNHKETEGCDTDIEVIQIERILNEVETLENKSATTSSLVTPVSPGRQPEVTTIPWAGKTQNLAEKNTMPVYPMSASREIQNLAEKSKMLSHSVKLGHQSVVTTMSSPREIQNLAHTNTMPAYSTMSASRKIQNLAEKSKMSKRPLSTTVEPNHQSVVTMPPPSKIQKLAQKNTMPVPPTMSSSREIQKLGEKSTVPAHSVAATVNPNDQSKINEMLLPKEIKDLVAKNLSAERPVTTVILVHPPDTKDTPASSKTDNQILKSQIQNLLSSQHNTGVDNNCIGCKNKNDEIKRLRDKNVALKAYIHHKNTQDKCDQFMKTDIRARAYTGLRSVTAFNDMHKSLESKAAKLKYWLGPKNTKLQIKRKFIAEPGKFGPKRKLSTRDELFLVLVKRKLKIHSSLIADMMGISESVVSSVLITWNKFLEEENLI